MLRAIILIDWRPEYLGRNGHPSSVLLAPAGPRCVAQCLGDALAGIDADQLVVAPNFDAAPGHAEVLRRVAPEALLLSTGGLPAYLDSLEPSDRVLLLDARFAPAPAHELRRFVRLGAPAAGAAHLLGPRRGTAGAGERVILDDRRQIRSIQREYDGVTRVETVRVAATLLSVAVVRFHAWPAPVSLDGLRAWLAARGVPGREMSAAAASVDLLEERGLLRLNEHLAAELPRVGLPGGFSQPRPGVWAAPGCRIAAGSRLLGPVVLHERVEIAEGAAVIGPTVLGAGVRLGPRATVSYAVLDADSRVPAGAGLSQRVLPSGEQAADAALSAGWESGPASDLRLGAAPPARRARLFRACKRGVDILLSAIGLALLAPLLLVTAALVKLTSRGPVFFGHEREGRGGRTFLCWKFRTMVARAHAAQRELYRGNAVDGPQFKLANDPRVTPLGRFLRASNIDELPQLYNVLRGEMSLIGPRPSPFRENQICIRWRNTRLSVRPGITGLWQVCRSDRASGDFHQWIYYDTLYVQHQCLALDLRILLATLLTLGGRWSVPVTWIIPARRMLRRGGPRPAARPRAQRAAEHGPAPATQTPLSAPPLAPEGAAGA